MVPGERSGRFEVAGLVKPVAVASLVAFVWTLAGWGINRLADGGDEGGPPNGVDTATIDEWDADNACQREVTSQVGAPAGTARFPDLFDHDDEIVITGSGSTLTIRSHVETWSDETSGMVPTDWTCRATRTSDGWSGESTLLSTRGLEMEHHGGRRGSGPSPPGPLSTWGPEALSPRMTSSSSSIWRPRPDR